MAKLNIKHAEQRALGLGLLAVILWSTVASGFKLGLQIMTTEQLLLLGTAISWAIFLIYCAYYRQFAISLRPLGIACALGLINPLTYYLVLFAAYDRLPAHIAQPINYTWAITMALLAIPLLGQKLNLRLSSGILLSYAGVIIIVFGQPLLNVMTTENSLFSESQEHPVIDLLGVGLALFSTLLWALYWLVNTRFQQHHSTPATTMMFYGFSTALPLLLVVCLLGPGLPTLSLGALGSGLWVGAIEMGVTFILWQRALALTNQTARIGQLIFLSPFLSLIFIHFLLDESINAAAILGLVVIVLGQYVSQGNQHQTT